MELIPAHSFLATAPVEFQMTVWDSLTGEASQHILTAPTEVAFGDPGELVIHMHKTLCDEIGEDAESWSTAQQSLGNSHHGVLTSMWITGDQNAPTFSTETIMRLAVKQ